MKRAPRIYLDQSTLSYAAQVDGQKVRLQLRSFIANCSKHADLLIALTHFSEAARMNEEGRAAFVRLLNRVRFKWARSARFMERAELEQALRRLAGLQVVDAIDVVSPDLVGAFTVVSPTYALELRAKPPTLRKLLDDAREAGWEGNHASVVAMAERVHLYGKFVRETGITEEARLARMKRKADDFLRENARQVAEELRREPAFMASGLRPGAAKELVVSLIDSEPRALPIVRVRRLMAEWFRDLAVRKQPGQKGHAALPSEIYDTEHACIGAVHCDVFTCDHRTAKVVAPVRSALGLSPLVTFTGGDERVFLRQLEAAVSTAMA